MKRKQSHRRQPVVAWGVLFLLFVLPTAACNGGVPETEPATSEPIVIEVAEVQTDVQVRREHPQVCAGSEGLSVLPELQDGEWHDLFAQDLITTDDDGEGWLKISDCMLIYVFQDSRLLKSACPKSDYVGGNVTCSLEGTSVYNNQCAGQVVIQTLTAELELQGTWLSVTYLPETQLSLVIVLDGTVKARPVVEPEARTLAPAVDVPVAHFWFTTPGVQADPIAGLAAREPHSSVDLRPLIEEMELWSWLDRIKDRAAADNVSFPELAVQAPTAPPTDIPPSPTTLAPAPTTPAPAPSTPPPAPTTPPPAPTTPPPVPTTPAPAPTTPVPVPTTPAPAPTTPAPAPTTPAPQPCADFEDLAPEKTFEVGDAFSTSGAIVTVRPYFVPEGFVIRDASNNILASGGTWYDGGEAWVNADYPWPGIQIGANLVNFDFDLGGPLSGLSLQYARDGMGYNIEINGDLQTFRDFYAISGLTIGGVSVSVPTGGSSFKGSLELTGTIDSFAIGGPFLWLDDVCPR